MSIIKLQKQATMKHTLLFLFMMALFCCCSNQKVSTTVINSKIKTEQFYRSKDIDADQIYAITVSKIASSNSEESSKCRATHKIVEIQAQKQIFRLSAGNASKAREEKIYQKLISLNEQENIIEEFQIIGAYMFIICTDGTGYFINQSNLEEKQIKVKTEQFVKSANNKSPSTFVIIKDLNERALVISNMKVTLCRIDNENCDVVEGYEPSETLRGAQIYSSLGKNYLFVINEKAIVGYELTSNGKLINKHSYDAQYFGVKQVSFRSLYKNSQNRFILLDDLIGLREIGTNPNQLNSFEANSSIIYQQNGCYQMVGQDNGDSIALACAPSWKTYFIMKILKSSQFKETTYEPLQTIFLHERLYKMESTGNILMGRVYSGVKLFWSSKRINNPYPYEFNDAGSVFLHNAIQAKMKIVNGVKSIYLAAEDEVLKYQLKTVSPYVFCYTNRQVSESYKLTYFTPCKQQAFMGQQNICKFQQHLTFDAWEHKEVKISTLLIPLLLSLFGVIAIIFIICKIKKKYQLEVEHAQSKYHVEDDHFDFQT